MKMIINKGSRVKYKSLASETIYYGTVLSINEEWAKVDQGGKERMISTRRLVHIPNVFAGKSGK